MTRAPWRDQIVTALIAFVSAFFGVALTQGSQLMVDLMVGDEPEAAGALGLAVLSVAWVFIGLGAYTAAVVTSNTFTTIVAGRIRLIAQYRLLGATTARLRGRLALEGLIAGLAGAGLGLAAAVLGYRLIIEASIRSGELPPVEEVPYTWFAPSSIAPAVVAVLTVWIAAYVGSRAVAKVSPVQALSANVETPVDAAGASRGQIIGFWLLMIPGLVLLLGGCALGAASPLGVLIAFWGGALTFTGVVVGARFVMPRLLAAIGRLFGDGAAARLARGNATRSPRAATRATIGMVVGVALIVMFVVALATMREVVWQHLADQRGGTPDPADVAMFDQTMHIVTVIMVALTGVSAVLAAIGMISNLALSVLQRRRELGLLRAVGASAGQIRSMILIESAVTAIVAIGFGAVLGVLYGWAGAQSTFGSVAGGFAVPVVPWEVPAAVAVAAAALALVAAIGPAIRATRITPIEALAVS